MTRGVLTVILLIGAWWSLLLLPWVNVGGEQLIGADLNQTMALFPAVSALSLLIALYRKLPRVLIIVSSLGIISSSLIALLGNIGASPAVIEAQERISGIAGGGDVTVALTPTATIFGFVGLILSLLTAALVLRKERARSTEVTDYQGNSRDLWDQQSE